MTIHTQPLPHILSDFMIAVPALESIQIDPRDYGFDMDAQELGRELLSQGSVNLSVQALPDVDADEFETLYQVFLA